MLKKKSAENEEDTAHGTFNVHEINESDLDFEVGSKNGFLRVIWIDHKYLCQRKN